MIRKTGSSLVVQGVAKASAVPVVAARPWAARGSMAIDLLLTWAIVDQRVAVMGPRMTEQEREVEASMRGRAFEPHRRSTDGSAKVEDLAQLNCRIDVSRDSGSGQVSDVADAVWQAVTGMADAEVLIGWASTGCAPDGWDWPTLRCWPRLGFTDKGQGVTVYTGKRTTGMATPVVIVSASEIAAARVRYVAWWDALALLAGYLSRLNLGFAVGLPSVAREPWGIDRAGSG